MPGAGVRRRTGDWPGFLPLPLTELVFFAEDGASVLAYLEEDAGIV